MASKHEVLILGQGRTLHPALREALHAEGFTTHTIFDFVDAAPTLKKLTCPILLVDSGDDDQTSIKTVRAVIQNKQLHRYPLVVAGFGVNSFEKALDEYFELATTLATPYKPTEVLEAFRYITKVYDRYFTQVDLAVPESALPAEPVTQSEASQNEAQRTLTQELLRAARNVPEQLFNELNNMHLIGGSLGGAEYTESIDAEFLDRQGYLSANPKFARVIRTICSDAGKWGRNHLLRTCFLSCRVLSAVGVLPRHQENVKAAAFLFAWSLSANHPDLLKRVYTRTHNEAARKELCSRIKDSAMKVAVDLGAPEIGNIVSNVGKLIGEEVAMTNDEVMIVASAVASADLIDRICFETGFWDPRAAYSLFRRCKAEPFSEMHPRVWGCCMKILSEAISANAKSYLLPRDVRENPDLIAARTVELHDNEQQIALPGLQPGMRLSRPLVAFDGREILSSDIKLDEDLIWRIWQLAALRPLNPPIIVATEH